jgi:deoxyribonuclease-1
MRFHRQTVVLVSLAFSLQCLAAVTSNQRVANFTQAKKLASRIHAEHPITIYCPCRFSGKTVDLKSCEYSVHKDARRARRLEWEHVVPAEAFGKSFAEWREGTPDCLKRGKIYKGRKCAGTNAEFSRMEADLYNLWPSIGELNGLRSNYSMAAIADAHPLTFGKCRAKIASRKFEPMDEYKGIVARVYMYMDLAYPGRGVISEKNRQLFAAWDRSYPVDAWECRRASKIAEIQGNINSILEERCRPSKSLPQTN